MIDMDAVIAELRKPDGWRKGWYGEWDVPDGSVCLLGAVRRVTNNCMVDEEATQIFSPVIEEQFPDRAVVDGWFSVVAVDKFNDHPDTTLDDVILVCEKARARMGEVA